MSNADAHQHFLKGHGWGNAVVTALPSDASFRQYHRLQAGERRALLMDAPPDREDIKAYVAIARHLVAMGFSAPDILALDEAAGLAVIEDFGDGTYTRLLNDGADPVTLYELAIDVLAGLHGQGDAERVEVPFYGQDKLLQEASLLVDWYRPAMTRQSTPDGVRRSYMDAWRAVFDSLPAGPTTLVLRDYHVDNLMLLEGRDGVARVGLLDFQDAVRGHPSYDLVSLLEDARRDVPDDISDAMKNRYRAAQPSLADDTLGPWYAILGVQRHAKIAGIFVRLAVRDGKPVYLPHIPRTMRLLARHLEAPELAPIKSWFDAHMPPVEQALPPIAPEAIRQLITV